MARRKKLHPIIRQIKQRLSEIATLKRTARMLKLDLSELEPVVLSPDMRRAKRQTKAALRQQVRDAFAPAPAPAPAKRPRRPASDVTKLTELDQLLQS